LSNKPRIFIVDDERAIASTLAMILESQGFDATHFNEPEKALSAARTQGIDLLVSDLGMPEMSGVELSLQLRTICPRCKVLLISGQTPTPVVPDDFRGAGHRFELLSKPAHPTAILRKIRGMLGTSPQLPGLQ
jgi:DNA-binding NtrC family response regulator